jgi:hypothetical protein
MPSHSPPGRRRPPVGYLVSGALLAVALLLCCGGGGWFAGPALRVGQGGDEAIIGNAIFDMHEGDRYWLYEPEGASRTDTVACTNEGPPETTYEITRQQPPFGASETITEDGRRYAFFGTLRGDRSEYVTIQCPWDEFLVVPSRTPVWSLAAALIGGALLGLAGLVIGVTAAVRRRPARVPRPAVPPIGLPPPPATVPVPPGAVAARRGPSPLWYLATIPFLLIALCACGFGGFGGLVTGFFDSFEAPEVGGNRSGAVGGVFSPGTEYHLYADVDHPALTEPVSCVLRSDQGPAGFLMWTDRPLGVPETVTSGERTFRYVGRFRVSSSVLGTVECEGQASLLVRPSNQPRLMVWVGLGVGVGALVGAATVAVLVTARRRHAIRAAAAGAG